MHLIVALGARPHMLRIGPVLPEFARAGISYDVALVSSRAEERAQSRGGVVSFFGLDIVKPRWFLQAGGVPTDQAGEPMLAFERLFQSERADATLVVGDTGVALAAAVTSARFGIPVVHLDAGLRCGDLSLPDEMNRVVVSRVASMHLTPTVEALENLEDEGIDPERIHFVGSTMAESVSRAMDEVAAIDAAAEFEVPRRGFVLASVHRPENLHDSGRLAGIVSGLERCKLPVVAPDSADLKAALAREGTRLPHNVDAIEPVSYHRMLALQRDAAVVVTDSSGVQIEACTIGTPCLTVRRCTEQAATIECGANRVVPASGRALAAAIRRVMERPSTWTVPQRWDRAVSDRVVRALKRGIMPLR